MSRDRRRLKAYVLKRKLLDEFGPSAESPGVLQFFYDEPQDPGMHYEYIRMKHLDEPELLDPQYLEKLKAQIKDFKKQYIGEFTEEKRDDDGSSVGAFDNPGRY